MTSEMISKEQSLSISYMKAIGILVVVIGHYSSSFFSIMQPYLYHMPLFFFVGGITLRREVVTFGAVKKIFMKLAPYMIITYIITGALALAIEHVSGFYYGDPFYRDPFSTAYLAFEKNMHNNHLFVVAWFLVAYFLASVLSRLVVSLANHYRYHSFVVIIISIIFGLVSVDFISDIYSHNKAQPLNVLVQTMYGSSIMLLGYALKDYALKLFNPIYALIAIAMLIVLISCGYVKQSAMAWSNYPSGYMMSTIGSILCISVIVCIANNLSMNRYAFFKEIGDNSLTIMAWHLSIFALITSAFYFFDITNIQNGKVVNIYNRFSFVAYVSLGVIIPLASLRMKKYIISTLLKKSLP
ncbi:acyltransferase family protein [Enterobacter cloacae]|uniref:acyltransferase family protein n=1 Tax=Enterobacter cloacae TaxID=550 RepID=UPI002A7EA7FA|nr:acyltransferase family protein [Enterobacter cloacae]